MKAAELRQTPPGLIFRACLCALAVIAAAIAVYLTWASIRGTAVVGCSGESEISCDAVLSSRWAKWLGIPVGLGAVGVYAVIAVASCLIGAAALRRHQRTAWAFLIGGATLVTLSALWFIALQVFDVKALCPYCMVMHVCGMVIAVLLLLRVPVGRDRVTTEGGAMVEPRHAGRSIAVALLGFLVLIAGQLLAPDGLGIQPITAERPAHADVDPMPDEITMVDDDSTTDVDESVYDDTMPVPDDTNDDGAVEEPAGPQRAIVLLAGRYKMNAYEEPILGKPDAPTVIVKLFDYTCYHCRHMHQKLEEAQVRYGDRLAVIVAPVPLNQMCNKYVKRTIRQHLYACQYVVYALRVWRADRAAFKRYHDWLFEPERPPNPKEAHDFAIELVGQEAFDKVAPDPWIRKTVQRNTRIHDRSIGRGLPKIVTRQYVEALQPHQLFKFLERKLKINQSDR
jgi:uncharacterized membrane protein